MSSSCVSLPHLRQDFHESCFFVQGYGRRRHLRSFPTRRSSDLLQGGVEPRADTGSSIAPRVVHEDGDPVSDRKSTRLNSSHQTISYAVFCLKKKILHHRSLVQCQRLAIPLLRILVRCVRPPNLS